VIDHAWRGRDLVQIGETNAAGQPLDRGAQRCEIAREEIAALAEASCVVEALTPGGACL